MLDARKQGLLPRLQAHSEVSEKVTLTQRPSFEQLRVLRLMIAGSPVISYYSGGFWGPPGQPTKGGFPLRWHTNMHAVRSLEKKGWIEQISDGRSVSNLETRKLTELGFTIGKKYEVTKDATKPTVVRVK